MDPDENEPGGVTQIPLIEDLVYNRSRPLQPPKKKVAGKKRGHYPPGYDPDTQDLFGGLPEPVDDPSADASAEKPIETAPTLHQNQQHLNQQPQNKQPQDTLTQEMTSQLADILQDLSDNSQDV